ncbi:hypothetical protein [Bacillus sp. FJAT-49736]|uniref:hypothetical protein n=1 Tax=Bacillus sp. FJAT-49736 TaxID=2833582 RepID=UPI001BC91D3A|nr:hypothetical protein [Bacillus sp. FJAT-49736]MBS4172544.1 hypothetical protein [Bacillus sp. FJAT-49736]
MTIFILFISIIVNVVTIFSIIILYLRQNRFLQAEQNQTKALKDMEEIFTSYLLEMKEENDDFIKKVQSLYSKSNINSSLIEKEIAPKTNTLNINEQPSEPPLPSFIRNHAEKSYQKVMTKMDDQSKETNPNDLAILPLEDQAVLLQKEGHTIEQIAQKLHKGKTEIELLLKFRQKM